MDRTADQFRRKIPAAPCVSRNTGVGSDYAIESLHHRETSELSTDRVDEPVDNRVRRGKKCSCCDQSFQRGQSTTNCCPTNPLSSHSERALDRAHDHSADSVIDLYETFFVRDFFLETTDHAEIPELLIAPIWKELFALSTVVAGYNSGHDDSTIYPRTNTVPNNGRRCLS